jgi:hypothetical protein
MRIISSKNISLRGNCKSSVSQESDFDLEADIAGLLLLPVQSPRNSQPVHAGIVGTTHKARV